MKQRNESEINSDWSSDGDDLDHDKNKLNQKLFLEDIRKGSSTESNERQTNKKRLSRPERSHSIVPDSRAGVIRSKQLGIKKIAPFVDTRNVVWEFVVQLFTFVFSNCCLSICGRMKTPQIRKMWREKVTLCILITLMMLALGTITFGLSPLLCRNLVVIESFSSVIGSKDKNVFIIHGEIYRISDMQEFKKRNTKKIQKLFSEDNKDLSSYFKRSTKKCKKNFPCYHPETNEIVKCHLISDILIPKKVKIHRSTKLGFFWKDIEGSSDRLAFNGYVLDMRSYFNSVAPEDPDPPFGIEVDQIIRNSIGKDASLRLAVLSPEIQECLISCFRAGHLETKTFGCIVTDIFLYVIFVIIFGVILIKFFLAVFYSWFIGRKLGRFEQMEKRKRKGGRYSSGSLYDICLKEEALNQTENSIETERDIPLDEPKRELHHMQIDETLYVTSLVTCYSESEDGIKKTLDSIACADYPDSHKLLFVITDGLVKGATNSKTTPEIVLGLMEVDTQATGDPTACFYIAVAGGNKRANQAKVYAGWYNCEGHRVATLLIVKCGIELEKNENKPGNRGKRDSQIILMSVFSKALFDDRMTPLEYDIFTKIHRLTGVFADKYDLVLMVDADTVVEKNSMMKMVCCMKSDRNIIGLCGETKILNKMASWVTTIQVFEYHISHHMNKSFESIFGCVTCLPGCFCMYRLKVQKEDGFWVPILASPEIIDCYSKNEVETLHEKNLLHLGEDRYLTTLVLKTFPQRKLVFVPSAMCWTAVPDNFRVLLSQRRRWINSTIHNLFELLTVPGMCGMFCFSMKFVIFMELVGTLVLPAAIIFTGVLIVSSFVTTPQYIPIFLLIAIFIFPAFLIFITTRKLSYSVWLLVYLLSLPVWNGIFPLYAYWHFDDFTWGETRKINLSNKKEVFIDPSACVDSIYLKRWHEWEYGKKRRLV